LNFTDILFFVLGLSIVIGICVALFSSSPTGRLKYHIIPLVLISIVFFLLGADLAGLIQLFLVSATTAAVLYVNSRNSGEAKLTTQFNSGFGGVVSAGVFSALLAASLLTVKWKEIPDGGNLPGVFEFARIFQTDYVLILFLIVLLFFSVVTGTALMMRGK
jgi:NADH:ubiquinone oxidoreductase subunit 6 (subunit J)